MRKLTAEEISQQSGVSAERVRQMRRSGEIIGENIAGVWFFSRSVITYIQDKPERRGRKPMYLQAKAT